MQNLTVKKYNTYKDSGIEWIGKIPQDWNAVVLKRVFSNRDGGAWGEEAQNNENDRVCIRIADFDYPKMTVKHNIDYTIRNYTSDVIEKLTLRRNDILIEKSGGGEQTPVGRTIIFNEDLCALYANFMDRLRVKPDISPKFIQYLLVSFYQNGITYQYIKQTTGIQNLDLTNLLAKEYIVLPTLEEQQAIADYLDRKCGEIDKVVETEKAVIEKLKEYKQSIITEAVTKGLDKSVPLKDSGIEWIGKIPAHWEVCKIKHIAEIKGRIGFKGYTTEDIADSDELGAAIVLGGTNIMKEGYISYDKLTYLKEYKYLESPEIMLYGGEILITKVGAGTGDSAIYEYHRERVTINPNVMLCVPKDTHTSYYINYYLLSSISKTEVMLESTKSGAQPAINQQFIKNHIITFPPVYEQQQIADYLDKKCSEIDKAIADKEKVIEKFTEYKKSLIYECVTGKKEIQ